MKNGFLKKALAFFLAGLMIMGLAAVTSANENNAVIPTPELQVAIPSVDGGFQNVISDNNMGGIDFNSSVEGLTVNTVQDAVYEKDDDGHDGFNGAYYFQTPAGNDAFNMAGNSPMVFSFDLKVGDSVGNGNYQILGKMNNDYGVQFERSASNDTIVAFCQTQSGAWPTVRYNLDRGALGSWTHIVVLFDGRTFWVSTDGGTDFYTDANVENFTLHNRENQYFGVGYNFSNAQVMGENIYLDNVKMYRSYVPAEDRTTESGAVTMAADLMQNPPLLEADFQEARYTVEETVWYEGDQASGNTATQYVPGNTYTFSATLTANAGYTFTAENIPSTIKVGYGSIPVKTTVDESGSAMTVTGTYNEGGLEYDLNRETIFWDMQAATSEIGQQTEADTWLYQIKPVGSDEWQNIPDEAFYPAYLDGTWMQSANDDNDEYGWAKINKTEMTCTFTPTGGTAKYQSVAYTWKAAASGYYRAKLETPIGGAGGSFTMYIAHAAADNENFDGEILLESSQYSAAGTFTSRIAEVNEGDKIRFIGTSGWATGFEPMIEEVSVREYAEQYLEDMKTLDTEQYTDSNVGIFEAAKEELSIALTGGEDGAIKTALENMEAVYEDLTRLYTVTYTKGNAPAQELKQTYNSSVEVMIDPDTEMETDNGRFVGWCLNGTDTIVSTEPSYSLYVAGDMELEAKYSNEAVTVSASASISNVHVAQNADGSYNVQFVSQLMVPQGYTLLEAGLVWNADAPVNSSELSTDAGPTVTKGKVNVPQVSSSYQYSVTIKNVSAGHTIHGVAFAKVQDASGSVSWLYSTPADSGLL